MLYNPTKKLLQNKNVGTFLVRYSSNKNKYYLHKKTKESNNHVMPISQVPDRELYYINEGFSYGSILEMLKNDRNLKGIDYPIKSPLATRSTLPRGMAMALSTNSLNIDNEEDEVEDIELLYYNHGKISEEDTEARLQGKPKGTFLIR